MSERGFGRFLRSKSHQRAQRQTQRGGWIESLERRLCLSVSTAETLNNLIVAVGQSSNINLNDFFTNPGVDSNTVFFNTTFGTIPVELTPAVTPQNVANFLSYVDSGAYTGTFVHRSIAGFVWQAGGYTFNNNAVQTIATTAPVTGEFSQSNVRGTIAMALSDYPSGPMEGTTDPDSGTDEFFFNLADNSQSLDAQKFTVFGSVATTAGLGVMDTIAQQPVVDEGSPFDDLPVVNLASGGQPGGSNLIYINNVLHNYTVQSSDPAVATVSESNSVLTYTPLSTGSTQITVTAEGLDGSTVNQTFAVNVEDSMTTTVGKGGAKAVSFVDDDGGGASVSLTGPGTATLEFDGEGIQGGKGKVPITGSGLHLTQISLTGTTAATTLHVNSLNGSIVPITSITSAGPLNAITAAKVTLTGTISIAGAIRSITLAATNAGSAIEASSLGKLQISTNAAGDVSVGGAVTSITVRGALSGSVTAGKINTVEAENLEFEHLTVTGTGTSLNLLRAGDAVDSTITTQGDINTVSLAGGVASAQIYAGLSADQAAAADAATTAAASKSTINTIAVGRGSAGNAFADSAIAAGTLKHVSTGNLNDAVASAAFFYGLATSKLISYHGYVGHKPLSLTTAATEAALQAELTKRKFSLTNLKIEIV